MPRLIQPLQMPRAVNLRVLWVVALFLSLIGRPAQGQFGNGFAGNRVGGVSINTQGVLGPPSERDRISGVDVPGDVDLTDRYRFRGDVENVVGAGRLILRSPRRKLDHELRVLVEQAE